METKQITEPVKLMLVKAHSFPEGIMPAFDKLGKLVGMSDTRTVYGLSRGIANDGVEYWAATEAKPGEAERLGLETYTIEPGTYLTETIADYMDHKEKIGEVFQQMIADPRLDPNTRCIEMYNGDESVECMVRIKP